MDKIYKRIKLTWEYPRQPTSLGVGSVRIIRGKEPFTADTALSQTIVDYRDYSPSFTEFIDTQDLEENVEYYYMIIIYGDIDNTISAATDLYNIIIEPPEVEPTPFQFKIHAKSQNAWLDLNSISREPGTIVEVNWGDGSETVVWTPSENFTPYHEYDLGTECFATVSVNQPIEKLYMNGPAVAEFNEFGNLPVQDLKFNFGQMTKVPETFPSFITRTNYMFGNCLELNDPNISNWDTSNITSMQGMFEGCKKLNQPLNWDVSNVTDMKYLFAECSKFNQDLSNWCVSNITSKPNGFNDSAPLFTPDKHPVWGTCPSGEDEIPDSDFTKATYIKTDTSDPVWVDAEYASENINGVLHIDWGDGAKEVLNIADFEADGYYIYLEHEYVANGEYVVKAYSTTKADYVGFGEITKVIDWGSPANLQPYFDSANLIEVPNTLHPELTSLVDMFLRCTNFNQDISMWDTSNVTEMGGMFDGANAFNQDISNWDVSNVTDMEFMFNSASSFNQNLNNWNTSKVTDMSNMFSSATSFNQDLSSWDVSKVTDMNSMFMGATLFNSDISLWNISNVTSISSMFSGAIAFNQDLSNWDTSKVVSIGSIFSGASAFNSNISSWNVGSVSDMTGMFRDATSFNSDLSLWDTSSVTSMRNMFNGATSFNSDISLWNVRSVSDMTGMFYNASSFNQDLSQWCVPLIISSPINFDLGAANWTLLRPVWGTCPEREENVAEEEMYFTTTNGYFNYSGNAGDVITFSDGTNYTVLEDGGYFTDNVLTGKHKVKLVAERSSAYVGIAGEALIELHNFPTLSTITKFNFWSNLTSPNLVKVPDSLPSNITNIDGMFLAASSFNQDISGWNVSSVIYLNRVFAGASVFNQDISGWDVSNVIDMSRMFVQANSFNQPLNNWDVSNVTNMSFMFSGATSFNQDLSKWDVSLIPNLPDNFDSSATAWTLPRPVWGTTGNSSDGDVVAVDMGLRADYSGSGWYKATDTGTVFNKGVTALETHVFSDSPIEYVSVHTKEDARLYGERAATSNLTDMSYMFNDETTFNQDISSWDVSQSTDFSSMFEGATAFNQPLNNWDVSNGAKFFQMFKNCIAFNQPLNNWNTSNTTEMGSMFSGATSFNQDISMWDTSNVVNLSSVFSGCKNFNQPVTNWNTDNVTDFSRVFAGCNLFNQPVTGWNTSNGTNLRAMFDRCFVFNQPVNHFVTSNCTDFGYMFNACMVFNQDLSNFDTSKATKMDGMFRLAKLFNYPLNHFVTTDVTTFNTMFASAFAFNQPLDTWNTSNATNMDSMFSNASKFNQDISSWNVKGVTNMDSMFYYAKAFTGNLSQWCVTNITSTPANFATSAAAFTKPVWGTCPNG